MRVWFGHRIAVVTVNEPIDVATEAAFSGLLTDALSASPPLLVVDLRGAGLFGSAGADALHRVWSSTAGQLEILITSPSPVTRQVLAATGLLDLPGVSVSEDEPVLPRLRVHPSLSRGRVDPYGVDPGATDPG